MTVVAGTIHSVDTLVSRAVSELQVARVQFTVAGTYAQADDGILEGVATLIQNSRRNGKTPTMRGVMLGTPSTRTDTGAVLTLKTVAISTNDITFEIATSDYSTEFTNATALPTMNRPFEILVAFTEA